MSDNDKEICVNPVDPDIRVQLETLKVINEFRKLGFEKREAFVSIVKHISDKFNSDKDTYWLQKLWVGRYKNADYNEELFKVIEKLKAL